MIWHIVLGMALDMSTYYIYPSRQPVPPSWATWRSCPCLSNQHHRQVLQLATWKRRTRRRCRAPQAPTPWCSPSTRPSTSSILLGQGWDYQKNIARIAKADLHKLPGKSSLNVRSVCPVCPGFPVCPDDHDDHDEHDYNNDHNHDKHGE